MTNVFFAIFIIQYFLKLIYYRIINIIIIQFNSFIKIFYSLFIFIQIRISNSPKIIKLTVSII